MSQSLKKYINLGRIRFIVQILAFIFLVYGGIWVGHYSAEKISGSLPALSCAYDQKNAGYCVLIPTQHQIHHRIGETLVSAQEITYQIFLPLIFTFLSFYLFFVFLNKMFCGWLCPLGTFQEFLYKLARWFGFHHKNNLSGKTKRVRPVKWVLLLVLVFILPLTAGLGVTSHTTGDAFCQICPSRILTTVATGDFEQLTINQATVTDIVFTSIRALLFGLVVIAALSIRQPFCRICPLLAFNALFQRLSPMRLVKHEHEKCEKCGICHKACPMDIDEIWHKNGSKAFHEDCTLCGRCAEYCPDDKIIQLKFGPVSLFDSSRDYYKARVKSEKPDGTLNRKKTTKK